jgi:hypothetical protein
MNETIIIPETSGMKIEPSASSSANDFDFLFGKWNIRNRKLKTRLKNSDEWFEFASKDDVMPVLNGFGNVGMYEAMFSDKPFDGFTLRLFNPETKLWSIYWADSNAVTLDTPVTGSFDGNTGYFYTRDHWQGTPIIMKFRWDRTDPNHPVWSQAFSTDEGQTWEWNWYMYFTR